MRRSDARDAEGFLAMQAPDCEWRVPGAELRGRDEVRGYLEPFWAAFPAAETEITLLVGDGTTIAAECVTRSVHAGPLATPQGDIPATGRELTHRFALVVAIDPDAEQAADVRVYYDQLELLAELGATPDAAAAG
jgi:uncharacterized protein (TIGR02246 family)